MDSFEASNLALAIATFSSSEQKVIVLYEGWIWGRTQGDLANAKLSANASTS